MEPKILDAAMNTQFKVITLMGSAHDLSREIYSLLGAGGGKQRRELLLFLNMDIHAHIVARFFSS